jgi:hypothetical protein
MQRHHFSGLCASQLENGQFDAGWKANTAANILGAEPQQHQPPVTLM